MLGHDYEPGVDYVLMNSFIIQCPSTLKVVFGQKETENTVFVHTVLKLFLKFLAELFTAIFLPYSEIVTFLPKGIVGLQK